MPRLGRSVFTLIDPVIHSDLGEPRLFGQTDRGAKGTPARARPRSHRAPTRSHAPSELAIWRLVAGIDDFLRGHKCNDVCRLLGLPHNDKFEVVRESAREQSSVNTTLVTVVQTAHLQAPTWPDLTPASRLTDRARPNDPLI